MQSINYITTWVAWITGLTATGITISCIKDGFSYYIDGVDVGDIFKKVNKKLRAGIILILMTSIISFLQKYWM